MQEDRDIVGNRVRIYPRGIKRIYCADFWHEGKHCRVSLKTRNRKVAVERAVALANALQEGTYQSRGPEVTIAVAKDSFLAFVAMEGRALKTRTRYATTLRTFQTFCESRKIMRLSKVTPLVVDAYRAERRKTCSPSTVFIETVVAKQLLRWCHSRRLIAVNPLASYRVPKVISKKRSSPSLEDVQAILSGSRPRLQRILGTLAFAGLRIGELRQLRVEDVDLADGWIRVESREGAETKTHRSRKIPIHPVLREILKEQSRQGIGSSRPSGVGTLVKVVTQSRQTRSTSSSRKSPQQLACLWASRTTGTPSTHYGTFSRPSPSTAEFHSLLSILGWVIKASARWARCITSSLMLSPNDSCGKCRSRSRPPRAPQARKSNLKTEGFPPMCNQLRRRHPMLSQQIAAGLALFAMTVIMSGVASRTAAAALDKSWTTGGHAKNQGSQGVRRSALTIIGSLRAESSEKGSPPPAEILFSSPAGIFPTSQSGSNHDPCPVPRGRWVNYLLKECVPTHRTVSFRLPPDETHADRLRRGANTRRYHA